MTRPEEWTRLSVIGEVTSEPPMPRLLRAPRRLPGVGGQTLDRARSAQDPSTLPPALPGEARTSGMNEPGDGERTPSVAHRSPALSLADLEAVAVRNNPTIEAARALVQQQQGLLRQVTRYPNPTVGWVQSTPSQLSQGATQGAFISQDYVTAGKLKVAGQAERAEIEWRCWQLKAQIGRVMNDVAHPLF